MSRLEDRLLRQLSQACRRFDLIAPNDRVMVAVSGGKDSWALLHLLRAHARRLPFPVSLVAVNLDQGQPGFPRHVLREHLESEGFEHRIVEQDTYSVVREKVPPGKTQCALCSRLRRGVLYRVAGELGATKLALGHHRDDLIETLLLNLFYAGQIKAMAPRLVSDDGKNVIIRPLALCAEEDLAAYATERGFPIVPCDLCGSQPNLQRQAVKRLLTELEARNPRVKGSLLAALGNVRTSHLLDARLGPGDPTV